MKNKFAAKIDNFNKKFPQKGGDKGMGAVPHHATVQPLKPGMKLPKIGIKPLKSVLPTNPLAGL